MIKKYIKIVLAAALVLLAGICYLAGPLFTQKEELSLFASESETWIEQRMDAETNAAQANTAETNTAGLDTATQAGGAVKIAATQEALLYIYVCGEVVSPGVYALEPGSRIYQAVDAAGGCTADGAAEFLNMAQSLEDGMKVYIPDRAEAEKLGSGQAVSAFTGALAETKSTAFVNINTATKEQLMTLRGVGEARAEDIITYREQNGPFQTIEDIMKVSGIKEAAFQKIKENITV